MRKTSLAFCLIAMFGFCSQLEAKTKTDPLLKVYSELKVGMTFSEVRDLAEKHYPGGRLEDTDVWGPDQLSDPFFCWVLGIDGKPYKTGSGEPTRLHRVFLRVDFDSNLKLTNAVYSRIDRKDFKKIKSGATSFAAKTDERKALVGDGYYHQTK